VRLGVYSDLAYRSDGRTLSTHQAFVRFVTALPPRVDEIVLFGRLNPEAGRSHYVLPSERVRFVPLPHYAAVTALGAQARAVRGSLAAVARELPRLDAFWIFGPHPMAVVLSLLVRRRGTPLFLGVRQDYPAYIANRLPSRRWALAIPVAHALERAFRLLARGTPTVAVGDALARTYAAGRAPVLAANFSLVSASDVVSVDEATARSWDGELRVLTVGRVDREKNPLVLADVVAALNARRPRWRLAVAGDGPLLRALERRLDSLGVSDEVDLLGYVANGPALWRLYRESHAFLHVSRTEGLPQVLAEAQAAGLPIVATAVGGVPDAVGRGRAALLVPPDDVVAAVRALERLAADADLRTRLIQTGLELAARETMEAQLDRVAEFLYANLGRR
jgi:glycosyltransferase involved in cell wall biosynthesis